MRLTRSGFLRSAAAAAGLAATAAVGEGAASAGRWRRRHGAPEHTKREWLFVQTARKATWRPKAGETDVWTLVLQGVSPQTVAFTDRPYREVHTPPTGRFLKGLNWGRVAGRNRHGNPTGGPNAAILAPRKRRREKVVVVSLYDPVYDPSSSTLTYDARPLVAPVHPGLRTLRKRQTDFSLPEAFDDASLFVDSCGTSCFRCGNNYGTLGTLKVGMCWDWGKATCEPCNGWTTTSICQRHFSVPQQGQKGWKYQC